MSDGDELMAGVGGSLTEDELARREALFHKRVKKQVAIMMSPKKFNDKQRAAAARLLGEYGEPTSIPYLVKAYRTDKSKAVRRAAGESLSMLKALGEMVTSDDEELRAAALEVVTNIIVYNQLGRPSRVSAGAVRAFSVVLIALALGVVGITVALVPNPNNDPSLIPLDVRLTQTAAVITPPPSPTSSDPVVLIEQFRDLYAALDADSRLLQAQMLTIVRQQPQDCSIVLRPTRPYDLPDILTTRPGIEEVAAAYNSAEAVIARVRGAFEQSCRTQQAIPRQEALALTQELIEAQRTLVEVAPIFSTLGVTLPPTPTAIPVPTNTLEPTLEPTPTETPDISSVRIQIRAMITVVNEMLGPRGKATLLSVYWQNVANGSTADCLQMPPPLVPGDIVVVPAAAELAPDLLPLADTINQALSIVRNSYQAFDAGCSTNRLRQLVDTQLPAVQSAVNALTDAQNRLNALQAQFR
jgi:hypothetical protein